jgi:MFS family permease
VIPDYVAPDRAGRASAWMSIFQSCGNAVGLLVAGFIGNPMLVGFILAMALTASYSITDAHLRWRTARAETVAPIRVDRHFRTLLVSRGAINVGFYTLLGFLLFYVQDSLRVVDVRSTTAMLFLAFTLCGIGGAVAGAGPADRQDKRIVVAVANAVVAVALIALALASSLPVAFVAAGLAGAAWGAFFTADWALACTILPSGAMASAMGIWNVAAAIPQVVAPLITGPLVIALNARQPGLGPRAAIVLAIVEFSLGAAWLWRLPASVTRSRQPAP